ncbi:hypothetical protein FMUAM8_08080 [Nocardia cyriacigeorgica]|uniref:Uncharacterized protein n=2 Tax=Nocardia cyriacigeorgica TaxID=135487 RepID=H6QZW0_NOCCG|nr:hypothetical protein FMUAM8_08080 [Nocardia cyriacigeorgica]CCF61625.1 protein of unknown function [Nocardia cyriacigeorgica GUH-2]
MDEPEPSGTAVSTLTCGQLSAMDEVEQKRNVDELAKRLNKPLIYSNPDGYRTVVAYCGDPDDLVTDSLPFA